LHTDWTMVQVVVSLLLPAGSRARDITVDLLARSVRVELRGHTEPLLFLALEFPIKHGLIPVCTPYHGLVFLHLTRRDDSGQTRSLLLVAGR
jgi:hypothetical protein